MEERTRRILIRQNPWWQGGKADCPEFERDMLSTLRGNIANKQVIALVGLRRIGKTVLLKQLIMGLDAPVENICYASFDDLSVQKYETAAEMIDYFLDNSDSSKRRFLFLDEIQKLPNWADLVKTYYDSIGNLKFFVSGSASLEIKKQKESLAGRILTFHLPPLSFSEFARHSGLEHAARLETAVRDYDLKFSSDRSKYEELFGAYLARGAFPELMESDDEDYIRRYIGESIVEKAVLDVSRLAGEDEHVVMDIFRLLAASTAQLYEVTNIASAVGVNRNRVSRCIDLLEKSFLIHIARNYTASMARQVRSSKKQHIAHGSIAIAMLHYPMDIAATDLAGPIVESTVAAHLLSDSFWRSPQKEEVDIIVKGEDGPLPIEVKYRSQVSQSDLRPILSFCRKYKAKRAFVATRNVMEKRSIDGVEVLLAPVWFLLLAMRAG